MTRKYIETVKDIISEKMIHVRTSAIMPEDTGRVEVDLMEEVHATNDLLESAWNEIKDRLDIAVEDMDEHPSFRAGYKRKAKHIHFYVLQGKDFPVFMKAIKEIVAEVLRNEKHS